MVDVVELTQALVRCPSVTPKDVGAQDVLIKILEPLGFTCTKLKFGDIDNLFARRGTSSPHFCFAGHTDVVPVGNEAAWTHPPFAADIVDGKVIGRGTSDMKGNIAAFVAAVSRFTSDKGSISLLITGDEEGPAINGTTRVLDWMRDNNQLPDACLVGEPSNPQRLGEEIKIGRRGSLCGVLKVMGVQGHVAYPDLAQNPLPGLVKLLAALSTYRFDQGNFNFSATNLEISTIDVGNTVTNVIPSQGTAKFNVRFNDRWTAESVEAQIRDILDKESVPYTLETSSNAAPFLTSHIDPLVMLVSESVEKIAGRKPALTTHGGTSDARFIHKYCPVVEFGLTNKTIHMVDEFCTVDNLKTLQDIYYDILQSYFV